MQSDQRTRMFRVLACLVCSMTGGAAFLGWLEPDIDLVQDDLSERECRSRAQLAVANCSEPVPTWKSATIIPVSDPNSSLSLAATRQSSGVHFLITSSGEVIADPTWKQQKSLQETGTIRIGMCTSGKDGNLRRSQYYGLKSLLAELDRVMSNRSADMVLKVEVEKGVLSQIQAFRDLAG